MGTSAEPFSSLLQKQHNSSFEGLLKIYLLKHFKVVLHQNIMPQMGGFIDEESVSLSILKTQVIDHVMHIKCSIFYIEQIGGCNCHDAPHEENGYLEQRLKLSDGHLEFLSQALLTD